MCGKGNRLLDMPTQLGATNPTFNKYPLLPGCLRDPEELWHVSLCECVRGWVHGGYCFRQTWKMCMLTLAV